MKKTGSFFVFSSHLSPFFLVPLLLFGSCRECVELRAEEVSASAPKLDLTPLEVRAKNGDAEAQTALGIFLVVGKEVERDAAKGFEWLEKAAGQKDPRGVYYWGLCFLDGMGTEKDLPKGLKFVRQAADLGYGPAKMFLGKCFLEGRYGLVKDLPQALELLTAAAKDENPEAQYWLGILYSGTEKSIPADRRRQMKWLTLSASHGFVPAQVQLGREYLQTGDFFWAQDWLEEAANAETPSAARAEALFLMGIQDLEGWGEGLPDPDSSVAHLQEAAEMGHVEAQYVLGLAKQKFGAELEAAVWLQRAALQGHAEAKKELAKKTFSAETCEFLGNSLLWGIGGQKNLGEAEKWLERGSKKGSAVCRHWAAILKLNGIGGARNEKKGMEFLKEGTARKDSNSLLELASACYWGNGADVSYSEVLKMADQMAEFPNQDGRMLTLKALCAFFGQGMPQDRPLAEKLFHLAALAQDLFANAWLGFVTTNPIPETANAPSEVWERIQQVAGEGNAYAQCLAGMILESGWKLEVPDGSESAWQVKPDAGAAFHWFEQAARQGCSIAQMKLFFCLEFGLGTDVNSSEAKKWLRAAADKNFLPALRMEETLKMLEAFPKPSK